MWCTNATFCSYYLTSFEAAVEYVRNEAEQVRSPFPSAHLFDCANKILSFPERKRNPQLFYCPLFLSYSFQLASMTTFIDKAAVQRLRSNSRGADYETSPMNQFFKVDRE